MHFHLHRFDSVTFKLVIRTYEVHVHINVDWSIKLIKQGVNHLPGMTKSKNQVKGKMLCAQLHLVIAKVKTLLP